MLHDHGDIAKADDLLATAQQMAAEGLVETRRAVHALRTDAPPLATELARVRETHAQWYHVAARSGTGGEPGPLPPETTVAQLRIAHEALVNAADHAAGHGIDVRLDYEDAGVRADRPQRPGAGRGPAPQPDGGQLGTVNGGYGLTGMAERLRLLDGTLRAGRDGGQWVVTTAVLRLPAAKAATGTGPGPTRPGTMAS